MINIENVWHEALLPTLHTVGYIFLIIVPLILAIAYLTYAERKVIAAMQLRIGPNVVGWFGLLQPFADGLKLLHKETIIPTRSNPFIFILAPDTDALGARLTLQRIHGFRHFRVSLVRHDAREAQRNQRALHPRLVAFALKMSDLAAQPIHAAPIAVFRLINIYAFLLEHIFQDALRRDGERPGLVWI